MSQKCRLIAHMIHSCESLVLVTQMNDCNAQCKSVRINSQSILRIPKTSVQMIIKSARNGRVFISSGLIAAAALISPTQAQVINEEVKHIADDGSDFDFFGSSVSIENGIIAVGAEGDDENGLGSGSVYLLNATTGERVHKLLAPDGDAGDSFGKHIAMDDGIIAVSALWDDVKGTQTGSVYLFDSQTGSFITKLTPNDVSTEHRFGDSVAIDDGIVVVGASFAATDVSDRAGAVYLFDVATGSQITKLFASDGEVYDSFGQSVDIDDGLIVVGAHFDDDNGNGSGSVYLFNASTHEQITKLHPDDPAVNDRFGYSVAIDDGTIVISAHLADIYGERSGSAYLFDASTAIQTTKLVPIDGAPYDDFGRRVSINNGIVAAVSLFDDDNAMNSGSAYLFDAVSGAQIAKLLASDGDFNDEFGASIAIGNGTVVIGTGHDDDNGRESGSIYVFESNSVTCVADLTSDGVLNFFDISVFLTLYQAGSPGADFNADGSLNFFDVSEFLTAFVAGCP